MTAIEVRQEIKDSVDKLSEKSLNEIFEHLKNIQQRERSEKNFERILKEDNDLLARLAK